MSLEAIAQDGTLRGPLTSGESGKCFECGSPMIGACGSIIQPYWSHVSTDRNCRYASERSESHWHKAWKYRLAERGWKTEQTFKVDGEIHRADLVHPRSGSVVEAQYKFQDAREVSAREAAYPHMLWLLNGALFRDTTTWEGEDLRPWQSGRLKIDAGAARSLHAMRRSMLIDAATPEPFRGVEDVELGTKGLPKIRPGIYYVARWDIGAGGGTVEAQCLYDGSDSNQAVATLDEWFAHLRWAA